MTKKILIVEDDPGILEVMNIILEEEGYEVESIADGSETFERVKSFHPKLIFMDLLISGTDGSEICAELKKNPVTRSIKVVLMSAHPQAGEAAVKGGADDLLVKPFEAGKLIEFAKKYTK